MTLFDAAMPSAARITLDPDFIAMLATMSEKQIAREWRCAVRHEATARFSAALRLRGASYDAADRRDFDGVELLRSQADAELARAEELSLFVDASLVSQLAAPPTPQAPMPPSSNSQALASSSAPTARDLRDFCKLVNLAIRVIGPVDRAQQAREEAAWAAEKAREAATLEANRTAALRAAQAPAEHDSVEAFVQFSAEEESEVFTLADVRAIASRTGESETNIRAALRGAGLRPAATRLPLQPPVRSAGSSPSVPQESELSHGQVHREVRLQNHRPRQPPHRQDSEDAARGAPRVHRSGGSRRGRRR